MKVHHDTKGSWSCRWHSPSLKLTRGSPREVQSPLLDFKVYWTLHQYHCSKTKVSTNKCQGCWSNFSWWTRSWSRELFHLPRIHGPLKQVDYMKTTSHIGCQSQEGHAYATFSPVWRSKMFSEHTNLGIPQSYMTSFLLYAWCCNFEGYIRRHQAPGCFPPNVPKDNPQQILAAHHHQPWTV